jgi:threonyl-tRNA synthetase
VAARHRAARLQLPERFDLTYTGADNAEHRPVMIHRALIGSLRALHRDPARAPRRRAAGLAGAGAGDRAADHRPPERAADAVLERCASRRRARRARRSQESVGRKIRDAELRKIPYMLVVGEREAAAGTVAVREHGAGDTGVVALGEFVERLRTETAQRSR